MLQLIEDVLLELSDTRPHVATCNEQFKMSYMLPHLDSGYAVDQAILSEEDRVVIIRFGHDWDPVSLQNFVLVFLRSQWELQACMKMDETLFHIADKNKNFAVM